MEWLDLLIKVLISAAISGIIFLPVVHFMMKRIMKPKYIPYIPDVDNWISMKSNPIPNEYIRRSNYGYLSKEILATDGYEVEKIMSLRYNAKGNLVLDFGEGGEITHWQPMPLPPKKKAS